MAGLEDHARFRGIGSFRPFLRTKFCKLELALFRTLVGSAVDRPQAEQIPQLLAKNLGHPASQLYVEAYCSDATRTEVMEIGDDQIANILNLAAFDMDRMIERLRHPVVNDEFSTEATLPIVMNAGPSPSANRLEVSPAITQQPVYANGMDPVPGGPTDLVQLRGTGGGRGTATVAYGSEAPRTGDPCRR